jgi:hypothetical protein
MRSIAPAGPAIGASTVKVRARAFSGPSTPICPSAPEFHPLDFVHDYILDCARAGVAKKVRPRAFAGSQTPAIDLVERAYKLMPRERVARSCKQFLRMILSIEVYRTI